MRVTKWSQVFRPNVESPIVPVWIAMEGLPIHLQDRRALFEISSLIGKPIKIDAATETLARPAVARVCIELDLTKEIPNKVWINCGSYGFAQPVLYENRPRYCGSCLHLGHSVEKCPKAHRELQPKVMPKEPSAVAPKAVTYTEKWIQKTTQTQAT
ncbi:unnamed protein product [Cuscuta epithymum]|uniref:DUF4283 domain-containing protein n=1 Tax=Cuscuta epithymum TaxID=186058 RepID=A0AAV0CA03_9ASTE|nr:unnamed protein product [Cuscuta epithymum]